MILLPRKTYVPYIRKYRDTWWFRIFLEHGNNSISRITNPIPPI